MPRKTPKIEKLTLSLPEDQLRELERRAIRQGLGVELYVEQLIRNHLYEG